MRLHSCSVAFKIYSCVYFVHKTVSYLNFGVMMQQFKVIYCKLHCSIKGVKVPVVILHALDDGIIPYELGHKVHLFQLLLCINVL